MSISYYSEDVAIPKFSKRDITKWVKNVITIEGKKTGDISIIFCSDEYLLDVNKRYLEHDYYTDIITFDYVEYLVISGDIFISVDRITENANTFAVSFSEELYRILIHGILHLLGFKDKEPTEKSIMTENENKYLKLLINS